MITFTNPWGTTEDHEVQRSDLWSLNLLPLTQLIQAPVGVDTSGIFETYQKQALVGNVADDFVQRVVLPENVIETIRVISGAQMLNVPGYDEPLGATRIDFFHEVVDNPTNLARSSAIYNLLRCWWLLATAGQQRYNYLSLPLINEASKPVYRIDLQLTFQKGTDQTSAAFDDGATYQLLDCWISDLQIMDFDYHNAGDPAYITATLQVGAILPLPPG